MITKGKFDYKKDMAQMLFVIAIIVLAMMSLQGASAANITINDGSSGGILGGINNPSVNPGDTVYLNPGTYDTPNQDVNIQINKSVTIRGNGSTDSVIIDGKKSSRIFYTNQWGGNVNVTFINLTFLNGYTTYGGAFSNNYAGTTMTFINCSFINNTATSTIFNAGGGAIYNTASNRLSIFNCTFTGNTASSGGGAIYSDNGFTASYCNFTGNTANYGGAIYSGDGSTISYCNFTSNTAGSGGGGAIKADDFTNVVNSIFTNNKAVNSGYCAGGAIKANRNLNVTNSTFISNFVSGTGSDGGAIDVIGNLNVVNSSFIDSTANSKGGAINNQNGYSSVTNSTFINSTATQGGAIYNGGLYFNLANSNFTNNKATGTGTNGGGGAISNEGDSTTILNCTFTNNTGDRGGAIRNNAKNLNVVDSTFINNTATNSNGTSSGGAINNVGTENSGNVHNSTFIGNNADYGGGAIYNAMSHNFNVTESNFINNTANLGGSIYEFSSSGFTIRNSNFSGSNSAIVLEGSSCTVTGCNIFDNVIGIIIRGTTGFAYVHYNRIFNNTNLGVFVNGNYPNYSNLDYNWWGHNMPPSASGYPYVLEYWFVMELSAGSDKTIVNKTTNLTGTNVNLSYQLVLYNNTTNTTSVVPYSLLPDFMVDLTWMGSNGAIYDRVNAKGYYSRIMNYTSLTGFKLQAIGDNEDIWIRQGNPEDYIVYDLYVNSSIVTPGGGSSWQYAVKNISAALQIIINNNLTTAVIHVAGGNVNQYTGSGINTGLNLNSTFNNLTILGYNFDNKLPLINASSGTSGTIFTISGNNIKLINLSFTGATTSAIYNTGNNLTINNSNFINNILYNAIHGRGGAIYNTGNDLNITNSNFTNNRVISPNPMYGGAIYNTGNNFNVANSIFINNHASNYGGAICNGDWGNATVKNSTFINNTGGSGAAVYNFGNYMNIANCTFTSNNANTSGGAIYQGSFNSDYQYEYRNVTMDILDCNFINNSARFAGAIHNTDNMTIINSNFTNNTALGGINSVGSGGAIYNVMKMINSSQGIASHMMIDNCNFNNNSALMAHAGAIYNDEISTMIIVNSKFVNNSAMDGSGGAIYGGDYWRATLNIVNCSFIDNYASRNGGAIRTFGNTTIVDCIFINNTAMFNVQGGGAIANNGTLIIINSNFTINSAVNYGGAIYNEIEANITITGCNFINNTASSGGAIYDYGGIFTIANSRFTNNSAANNGGAVSNLGDHVNITGCNFTNNNATYGGAIYNGGDNFNVINSNFTNNRANAGGAIYNNKSFAFSVVNSNFISNNVSGNSGNYGGAIYNNESINFSISGSNFLGNNAGRGGAIYNTFVNATDFTIVNSNFVDNRATYGGAIYNFAGSRFTVIGSNFTDNNATDGGAIYNSYGGASYYKGDDFTITNSTFANNNVINDGGAIWNNGYYFTITNSTFANNNAIDDGGAIYNAGYFNLIIGSTFTNNAANRGGSICNIHDNVTIFDSNFFNNRAIYGGGAIYNFAGVNLTVNASTFTGNNATYGGAICNNGWAGYFIKGDNFTVVNSTFANNRATYGGVIYNNSTVTNDGGLNFNVINSTFINNGANMGGVIYNTADNFTIANSKFNNNSATGNGGVIYNTGLNFRITGSSFNNNDPSYGGVIYNTADYFTIADSNFTNNSATNSGGVIYNTGNNFSISNSNFKNNNATYNGGAIYNSGSGLIIVNSNFTNNTATVSGGAIYNLATNFTLNNSTFNENSATYGGSIFHNGTGNIVINGSTFTNNTQAIGLGNTNYQLNNNTIKNNTIAIQFVLNSQTYTIPDLIGTGNNIIANNTYVIGISGSNSTYTLADSSYNTSGNRNGVIFTGMGVGSTNSGIANGNKLINSNIRGYSGVGITFDRSSRDNIVSQCNISNNAVGVVFNGFNNTLISSNIINNVQGINVTSNATNSVINYNRIYNNTNAIAGGLVNYGTLTNANFNWWSQNNIANLYVNNGGSLNLTYWYVLQLSLNFTINNTVNTTRQYSRNQQANLSYRLGLNNNWTLDVLHDPSLLPHFNVTLYLNNSTSVIFSISDQDARFYEYNNTVMLTNTDPSAKIRVLSDDEDLYLELEDQIQTINITVTKTVNTNSTWNGQELTYTITVINHGPDTATNVTVTDVLDYRLALVGSYDNVTYVNATRTLTWTIESITNGTNATLSFVVSINGTGIINNTVVVNTPNETNIGNNTTTSDNTNATPAVNLTITKSVIIPENVTVGSILTYTINVTNHGPDVGHNVVVTDVLDPRLVYVNSSATKGSYDNNTGNWTIGTLGVDDFVQLNITVWINGTGTIVNRVNVTVDEPNVGDNGTDGNDTNVTLPATVNLTITKSVIVPENVTLGSVLVYIINVTNHGPDIGHNVVVTDVLDPRLVYINSTADKGSYDNNTGLWTIGTLGVDDFVQLNITVWINGTGTIINKVNVTVDEPNVGNNSTDGNDTNVTLPETVNLTVTKSVVVPENVTLGSVLVYIINVTNHGPDIGHNVIVTDVLDPRLVYVNSTATRGSYDNNSGLWTIGTLGVEEFVQLNITVWINGTGTIINKVNVTVDEPNVGNNSTDGNGTNVTLPATVNLTITKSVVVPENVTLGSVLVYVINVTNHGPDIGHNVIVTDNLDPRLVYMNSSATRGSYDNNTYNWTIGTLGVEEFVQLNITVWINGTGTIVNKVNVTVDEPNVGNNSTDGNGTNVTIPATVNLTITKTVIIPENVTVGSVLVYVINVTNHGPDIGHNVIVTDILDPRLVYVNSTATRGSYDNNTGLWNIGTLDVNDFVQLNITVWINGTGTIINKVNVTVDEPNVGNNSTDGNDTNVTLPETVNLTVTKSVIIPENVTVGSILTYTINVTNHGPDIGHNVVVTDILDPRLVYINSIATRGSYDNNTGLWTIGTLGVDEFVQLNITVWINGTGTIINKVNVTVDEPNVGNNSTDGNDTNVTLPATVNLTITKSVVIPENVTVGSVLVYVINVTNHGPDVGHNVVVTDILDPRLVYVNSTATRGSYDNNTGLWIIGTLGVDDFVQLNITVVINGTGTIMNRVNVTVDEPNVGNNSTDGNDTNVTLPETVNLTVTKSVVIPENVTVGSILTYTINVTNHGPDNGTGVVVTDVLDSRLIYTGSNANKGSYDHNTGLWSIGALGVGEFVQLNITVVINGTGNINNVANVTVNEPNVGNNTTEGENGTNVTLPPTVNLTIIKSVNVTGNVVMGQLISYTIVVTNHGPDNGTGVVVADRLDPRLVYISSNAIQGSYDPVTTFWNIGNMSVGATVSLNIVVRVNGSGDIVNVANVTVNEVNIGNNSTDGNGTNITVKVSCNSTITIPDSTIGKGITIKGIAKDEYGAPLVNTKLTVIADGKTYTVTTNNLGEWNLYYTPTRVGNLRVSVTWNGNSTYNGFVNSTSFVVKENSLILPKVKKNTTLALEVKGDKITATLVDEDGNPLTNKEIVFRINDAIISIGVTNKDGEAIIYYKDVYKYRVNAKFEGDADYRPSSAEYISDYEYILKPENVPDKSSRIGGIAAMKKTGMPFVAMLLVLLVIIGLLRYRKN